MSPRLRVPLLAAALGALAACASGSSGTGAAPAAASRSNTRMDSAEFRKPEFRTLYDAVRILHPDWLQARGGPTSAGGAQTPVVGVFIEGQSRGYGLDKLAELDPRDVKAIRRLTPSESLGTYGSQWPWGGILVTVAR